MYSFKGKNNEFIMTKVQENLILKWLECEIDDEDAQLLIKDF